MGFVVGFLVSSGRVGDSLGASEGETEANVVEV